MPEKCETLEELRWTPGLADCDLKMYLRAARSMAAFAGMCDGGSAEDGCLAASRDDTTINALQLLHESNYDTGKALQALVKSPVPKGIEKKWTEEEQKRFVKGLRLYGKNFFKIRKELLSHKETPDLVEYYYLWKKTPQAASARPHRRHRRCVLRRIRNSGNNANNNCNTQNKANTNNKEDASSASEEEVEQTDDSDSNTNSDLTCSNCGTLAKELHQTGTDRSLLCNECRNYMKKYGKHRPLDEKESKSVNKSEDDSNLSNGKPNLRTRKGKDKGSKAELNRGNSKSSETSSPDGNEMINSTESSSNSSETKPTNGSTSSEGETKRSDIPKKRHFSNLENSDSINDNETNEASTKENDSEPKRKRMTSESGNDEQIIEEKEIVKEETAETPIENQEIESAEKEANDNEPDQNEPIATTTTEAIVDDSVETKNEDSNHSVKEEVNIVNDDSQPCKEPIQSAMDGETEKIETEMVSIEAASTELVVSEIKEESAGEILKAADPSSEEPLTEAGAVDKSEKTDKNILTNLKVEPPSSPKSPQDLSSLSSRDREKRAAETVPFTSSQTSTSLTVTNSSATSPVIKKEEHAAINFPPTTPTNKVSPSSSPNPIPFPFSQTFPQMPPSLATPTSMADRFPYLIPPPLNYPPAVSMNPENVSSSPKLVPSSADKSESEHKIKDETRSSESSSAKSVPIVKSEASRNLQSPKTISTAAPTFPPSLASPFGSAPNDPFMLSNPAFAASHLATGGDRLPFPNPLMNYPPGFPPHLSGLSPFMNMSHWSQYAARLPPGAFPSPYLPPAASPMSSHSPHSQMSKSKSPISSQQSSSHHSSPSHFSSMKTHENKDSFDRRDRDVYQQDDDDMETSYLPRGPSPEPKIEDSECHRSQSAIFLRHWNRGEYNSCARTDLTFKPVPDSSLARKREERARKAAEKEREDHKQKTEKSSLEMKPSNHGPPQSSSNHESSHLMSPLGGRHTPRNFDTPALRQLSEYARPHATYSPFSHPQMAHNLGPTNMSPLGLHGPNPGGASLDPISLAQYQMYQIKDAEEKQKLAIIEKQKEMEMKSRSASAVASHNANLPPTSSANSLFEQHATLLEMQRRLASSTQAMSNSPSISNNPSTSSANGLPLSANPGAPLNPFMPIFSPNERVAQEQMQQMAAAVALQDRYQAERLAMDPLFRLQMGLNHEIHGAPGGAGAHPFQHPSHPAHSAGNSSAAENAAAAASMAAAMGIPSSQFDTALQHSALLQSGAYPSRPPSIMPRPELTQQNNLFRSFEDQLSHQISAHQALQHEQLQRQMMERERMMHFAAAAASQMASSQMPHAAQFQIQEEYLRQREREMKLRGFDDVARNGRPPM